MILKKILGLIFAACLFCGAGFSLFASDASSAAYLEACKAFSRGEWESAALTYGVPQVVVPGRVFERIYNAESIERVGAGVKLEQFNSDALRTACERVVEDASYTEAALTIRQSLSAGGGAAKIVQVVEDGVVRRS